MTRKDILLPKRRDYFQLDRDRRRQGVYFDGGPRWVRLSFPGEVFGVELIVGREVGLHVREENGDIDDVAPARAGIFQHEPHVLKDSTALRRDVVIRDLSVGVEGDARNFFAAPDPRTDAGKKK